VAVDPVAGFDGSPILARVAVVMTNPATRADLALCLRELLARPDRPAVVIADSPGFVAQRVIATIANIACEIAQRGIASPADIDVAVHLGLGYPKGPLALADTVGPARIVTILDRLLEATGDPRYRTSPWLRRRAALGMGLAGV
jgi:3-hydroxybutyryl-CoA dehydrogenase